MVGDHILLRHARLSSGKIFAEYQRRAELTWELVQDSKPHTHLSFSGSTAAKTVPHFISQPTSGYLMPHIDTNGLSIAYEESGNPSGPPVVLITGLGMQLVSWPDAFLSRLEKNGFRVIRFDNRDIGLSSKLDHAGHIHLKTVMWKSLFKWPIAAPYTLDDMADDTIGLMDVLNIDKAAVIGVSMGGMIAQILAARFPDRVSHLISIMSSTGSRKVPAAKPSALSAITRRPPKNADIEDLVKFNEEIVSLIGSPAFPPDSDQLRKRLIAALERSTHRQGMPRQFAAILATGSRTKELKTITTPSLVIHGTDDPLVRVEGGIQTAETIPNADLKLIDGMGHDLAPGALTQVLDAIVGHLCNNVPCTETKA